MKQFLKQILPALFVTIMSLVVLSVVSSSAIAGAAPDVNELAKNNCKSLNGGAQNACEKGYKAGYNGGNKTRTCDGFNGRAKDACKNAYDRGKEKTSTESKKCDVTTGECTAPAAAQDCGQAVCDLAASCLNPLIRVLSGLVGVAVAGSIILGGIQYSASGGDPQKAAKAKNRITNAIFALMAYLFIWAFLQFLVPGGVFNR